MNLNDERRLIVGLLSCRDPARVREESLASAVGAVRLEARRRRAVRCVSQVCATTVLGLLLLALFVRTPGRVAPDVPGADHATESTAPILRGSTDLAQASLPFPGPLSPPGREESKIETREAATSDAGSAPAAEVPDSPRGDPDRQIAIETIDDQELLALLAGRTVALIGPPGHEQLLVLDAPKQLRSAWGTFTPD